MNAGRGARAADKARPAVFAPIAREGWPFVALFALAALLLYFAAPALGALGLVLTCWCAYFFRDPERVTPARAGLVVSPADGSVQQIAAVPPPPELQMGEGPRPRVSIFMNVFDVHVNRVPADGAIAGLAYRPGKFLNASFDKASEANERQAIRLNLPDGRDLAVVQIAGLIARRIKCGLSAGQQVRAGQRLGMIRFGSRVDLYLPEGAAPLVCVGQRAVAGETVIADLMGPQSPRTGEVR